jgi:hypothetical protein
MAKNRHSGQLLSLSGELSSFGPALRRRVRETMIERSTMKPYFPRSRHGASLGLFRSLTAVAVLAITANWAVAEEREPNPERYVEYETQVLPILKQYCYDCHAYGADEGRLVLDQFSSPADAMAEPELWWRVLKNLRAGVMPPKGTAKPTEQELDAIKHWVAFGPLGIDPENLDPGPVTISRLNREQYGSTLRQLMGVPFNEKLLFPPDDSGHGFDNVADALTVSPLLLDKYLQAAEWIVDQAVPRVTWIVPRKELKGSDFRSTEEGQSNTSGRRLDGKKLAKVAGKVSMDEPGRYRVQINVKQHGSFEFDPARYVVTCLIDGQERFAQELGWDENKRSTFEYEEDWQAGEHEIVFALTPVAADADRSAQMPGRGSDTNVSFEVEAVSIEGPLGTERRVHPENYERFFTRDNPPSDAKELRMYAEEVLSRFAVRAYRGRVNQATVDRLVEIAESIYSQPEATFEEGVARAMVATLVSPKFLFRIETALPAEPETPFALIDELSLASRLSYFIWSSMPDEELFDLAEAGQLRAHLASQLERMLADPKAEAFVTNFVGQWLRTRDVQNSAIDAEVVLGLADEMSELREWMQQRFRRRDRRDMSDEERARFARLNELREILGRVDGDLKHAAQEETEMLVEHIVRTDASLLDLLDCDYTFLNEKLAKHYGIEGVKGNEMRLVQLPADSPRGGVLTHASILMVTSNPTRTSPVKRGLFILDNILGTPAPPAPNLVPELEESANRFAGREPTLRELLEVHRESDLCASCHARMDPLGFALENFDALGMWRDKDGEAQIDPKGELVTGDAFDDIRSLKKVLREKQKENFYRCITEKLLVYAIGRGIEYTDEYTVDQIVQQLDQSGGRFKTLVHAIVESAPFQKQRLASSSP